VSTDPGSWWGGRGVTVPHGLIAAYGGDTALAARKFMTASPPTSVTVLVDFENDSVRTALEVAGALGSRLWGVRLDTSELLVDRSLWEEMGDFNPTGVNPRLVRNVRDALDARGFDEVKIVVSGGFTVDKIREFEEDGVPVDAYGVGSSLIRGSNDFTGDIVLTNGKPSGCRCLYRPNPRLELCETSVWGRRHTGRLRSRERETCGPDAEAAVLAMARLVEAARWRGSARRPADDHEPTDTEISEHPDRPRTHRTACAAQRRGEDRRDRAGRPGALALTMVPERWLPPGVPAAEEELERFTNPNAGARSSGSIRRGGPFSPPTLQRRRDSGLARAP
jgi:hypothetical protein